MTLNHNLRFHAWTQGYATMCNCMYCTYAPTRNLSLYSICMSPCAHKKYIPACVCPGVYLFASQGVCPTVHRVYIPPCVSFSRSIQNIHICHRVYVHPRVSLQRIYVLTCIRPTVYISLHVYVPSCVCLIASVSSCVYLILSMCLHVYVPTRPGACMFRSPTECMCVRPTLRVSPPCVCPGIPAYECHHPLYAPLYIYPSVCVSRRVYVPSCVSR